MLEIIDVGISGDTILRSGAVISGRAVVYSKENEEDFEDDFSFQYDCSNDNLKTSIAVLFLGDDYFETIREMLLDNLQTNFI